MWRISQTIAVVFTVFIASVWLYYDQVGLKEKAYSMQQQTLQGEGVGPELIIFSDDAWKKRLSPEQYHILREGGTEPPYSGELWNNKEEGIYRCAACDLPLFSSKEKYDSQTGWPSFWEPINVLNVAYEDDYSLFIKRIEVLCARCRSHIGHVFEDGPPPTGLRYCMNSLALKFELKK